MDSWNCVVVCRRTRASVDEVLVQWECSWIAADEVPQGEVVRTLLGHTEARPKTPSYKSSAASVPPAPTSAPSLSKKSASAPPSYE